MEDFEKYLAGFPHYKPEYFKQVLPYLTQKTLRSGDFLVRQGKVCKEIAFVKKGLLRLFYLNKDGREITQCFCKEGELATSYISMIYSSASDIAIQAIEPTEVVLLPYNALLELYEQNVFWQQVGRLAAEQELIAIECHNRFLSDLSAREKYEQILTREKHLLQRVPLGYLASYMQITPETLSRIRRKASKNTSRN